MGIPTPGADARIQSTEIGLDVQHASPPTAAYVGKDDSLWIMCSNNAPSTVTVNARFLMPSGEIKLNQWTIAFTLSRSAQFKQIQLTECFLLSVAVVSNTASSATNISCYVAAIVSRLVPTAFNAAQSLCQGYSSGTMPISWPTGVNTTNVDCAGVPHVLVGGAPIAGAEISETVPANAKWKITSIQATFTTSATAGNRFPAVTLDDGTFTFGTYPACAGIAAASQFRYTWLVGALLGPGGENAQVGSIPAETFLMPGFRIRTLTTGLAAGDQWSAPTYLVQEWLLP